MADNIYTGTIHMDMTKSDSGKRCQYTQVLFNSGNHLATVVLEEYSSGECTGYYTCDGQGHKDEKKFPSLAEAARYFYDELEGLYLQVALAFGMSTNTFIRGKDDSGNPCLIIRA